MMEKPTLLCWLTCDGVHIDPDSGKHSLLGIFSSLVSEHYPFTCPYMIWFLSITDCTPGEHVLRITMGSNPVDRKQILERPFKAQSPTDRIGMVNEIKNMTVMRPGDHSITIEIDDEILLVTSLIVTKS